MGRWRILCYHGVRPEHAAMLHHQLQWFTSEGWTFRSFSQALAERGLPGRRVSVSIDDGDASTFNVVQPVLTSLGITGMLYLASGLVHEEIHASTNGPTWKQVAHWLATGHEVGGHTHQHIAMVQLSVPQMADELALCSDTIRRELGIVPVHLAYPWGKYNRPILRWLHSQGQWQSAVTIERGQNRPGDDVFRLSRDVMAPDWTARQVRWRLATGICRPLYRCVRALRPLPVPA